MKILRVGYGFLASALAMLPGPIINTSDFRPADVNSFRGGGPKLTSGTIKKMKRLRKGRISKHTRKRNGKR